MGKLRIFSPEDKDKLRRAKRRGTEIIELLDRAERCNIDCQQRRQQVADSLDVLNRVEQEFMQGL